MLNIELSCFSVYFPFQICRCKRGGLGGGADTLNTKKRMVFQWVLQGLSQLENVTVAPVSVCHPGIVPAVRWARKWQSVKRACSWFPNAQVGKWGFIFGIWSQEKSMEGKCSPRMGTTKCFLLTCLTAPRSWPGSSLPQRPFSTSF